MFDFLKRLFGGGKSASVQKAVPARQDAEAFVFGDDDELDPPSAEDHGFETKGLESIVAPPAALWYPTADTSVEMPTRGAYRSGHPVGAVVHYTAGHFSKGDENAAASMRYGASSNYAFFCISTTGRVYQGAALDRWGSHAGDSYHADLGKYVSTKLVGIEICNAGLLERTPEGLEPWWNWKDVDGKRVHVPQHRRTYIPESESRTVEKTENITQAGIYHAYTAEQETALTELLLWLAGNAPGIFSLDYVFGHDEVAVGLNSTKPQTYLKTGRKQDPGGALSMTMPSYRTHLKSLLDARRPIAEPGV